MSHPGRGVTCGCDRRTAFDYADPADNDPVVIGTTAGSYRITSVVSVGGMGTVYRAEHSLIGRIAAVKVLHPEMTAS